MKRSNTIHIILCIKLGHGSPLSPCFKKWPEGKEDSGTNSTRKLCQCADALRHIPLLDGAGIAQRLERRTRD